MSTKKFQTTFLDLAASIAVFTGIDPDFEIVNHKVILLFPATDEIYRAIGDFNSNSPIPVFDFSQKLRKIRSQMMGIKNGDSISHG